VNEPEEQKKHIEILLWSVQSVVTVLWPLNCGVHILCRKTTWEKRLAITVRKKKEDSDVWGHFSCSGLFYNLDVV